MIMLLLLSTYEASLTPARRPAAGARAPPPSRPSRPSPMCTHILRVITIILSITLYHTILYASYELLLANYDPLLVCLPVACSLFVCKTT